MNQVEEDDQDTPTIVLMPAGQRGFRMPGTVIVTAGCGHQALMAPHTATFLATPAGVDAPTICTDCFAKEDLPEDARMEPLPGADTELVSVFGVAVADQLVAAARDRGLLLKASKPDRDAS